MADTAALLGSISDELYYDSIASKTKSAIQKGLIDDRKDTLLIFIGGYVLAIAFDLALKGRKSIARTFDSQNRRKRGLSGYRVPDDITVSAECTL